MISGLSGAEAQAHREEHEGDEEEPGRGPGARATGNDSSERQSDEGRDQHHHRRPEQPAERFLPNEERRAEAETHACQETRHFGHGRRLHEGDADGPDEMHVILLDNGRVDMLAHGYGEALCCVRCGACLNVCPVYREIGGHAYGSTYSGPIGAVISGLLHNSVTDVKKLPYASSLCGACRDACPVKIDLPRLLLDLRSDVVEEGETARMEKLAMQNFAWMMSSRSLYESAGKMASGGSNLLAWFGGGTIKAMPGFAAWTDTRNFPPFAKHSFRDQWRDRQARRKKIKRDE